MGTRVRAELPAGVGVALVTLFHEDGALDAAATAQLALRAAEDGAASVLLAGTTGEGHTLTQTERVELLAAVRGALPQLPLLVGLDLEEDLPAPVMFQELSGEGADGVLVHLPGVLRAPPAEWLAGCAAVSPLPVMAYHHPRAGYPSISLQALAGAAGVQGVKDSSGEADRVLASPLPVHLGSWPLLPLVGAGLAAGALLGIAGVGLSACQRAALGDLAALKELAELRREIGPDQVAGVKRILARTQGTSPRMR